MADLSDCEIALREAVQAARTASGGAYPCYRGWPAPAVLDGALSSGKPVVTVYSRPGYSRTTTRFPNEEQELPRTPPTLTVTVVGQVATFAGTGGPAQLAGVQVGHTAYSVRALGTPSDTAAALAAIVPGATASGAALTVPGLAAARTGADGATLRPTRQLQQGFAVIVWAADPGQRDAVSAALDTALSDIAFLALQDGSRGRLTYAGTTASDKAENAGLYRRDLNLIVEYSTTIGATRTPALFAGELLQANAVPGTVVQAVARIGALAP